MAAAVRLALAALAGAAALRLAQLGVCCPRALRLRALSRDRSVGASGSRR
jgi:hypothetical protein